jgi:ABC-type glycerol-3-phosphate transport system permease component
MTHPIRRLSVYATLLALGAAFLVPFLWVVASSFKSQWEFTSPNWIPQEPTFRNYVDAVTLIDFAGSLKNSVLLASLFTVLNVFMSSLAGYAFARLAAPGRDKLFALVISTIFIPQLVTFIPQFVLFSRLELVGTWWPWVLWGLQGGAIHVFLFRQFYLNFPRELEEAAEIDGCGPLRIYFRIFVPNSAPVIAVSAIFSFQWVWGDYIYPALLLDPENTTLGAAMAAGYFTPGQALPLFTVMMAGMVIYAVPLIIVFFLIQRYIIQGIVTSGLKG